MNKWFVCVSLVVCVLSVINADPKTCYECNILNKYCNSPINVDHVKTQSCDNINTHKNTTSKVICFTTTATWLGQHVTERGCYYAEMEGIDVCTYFNKTEANGAFTKDFTCNICSTDMCNKS